MACGEAKAPLRAAAQRLGKACFLGPDHIFDGSLSLVLSRGVELPNNRLCRRFGNLSVP